MDGSNTNIPLGSLEETDLSPTKSARKHTPKWEIRFWKPAYDQMIQLQYDERPLKYISRVTGYTTTSVSKITSTDTYKLRFEEYKRHKEGKGADPDERLLKMKNDVIDVVEALLKDPKVEVRRDAAKLWLQLVDYKPKPIKEPKLLKEVKVNKEMELLNRAVEELKVVQSQDEQQLGVAREARKPDAGTAEDAPIGSQ